MQNGYSIFSYTTKMNEYLTNNDLVKAVKTRNNFYNNIKKLELLSIIMESLQLKRLTQYLQIKYMFMQVI